MRPLGLELAISGVQGFDCVGETLIPWHKVLLVVSVVATGSADGEMRQMPLDPLKSSQADNASVGCQGRGPFGSASVAASFVPRGW